MKKAKNNSCVSCNGSGLSVLCYVIFNDVQLSIIKKAFHNFDRDISCESCFGTGKRTLKTEIVHKILGVRIPEEND